MRRPWHPKPQISVAATLPPMRVAPLLLLLACQETAPRFRPTSRELDPRTGISWITPSGATGQLAEHETTVAEYARCVAAGACSDEKVTGVEWKEAPWSPQITCNWGRPGHENHPMNCVDWPGSDTFCRWAGGRLLTKQEWHDEATDAGRRPFPWGSDPIDCDRAVHNDWMSHPSTTDRKGCGRKETWPVCEKPLGNSVHGLCDVVGNVWEWTDTKEFPGPEHEPRYNLGGGWSATEVHLDTEYNLVNPVLFRIDTLGMRCWRPSDGGAEGSSGPLRAPSPPPTPPPPPRSAGAGNPPAPTR